MGLEQQRSDRDLWVLKLSTPGALEHPPVVVDVGGAEDDDQALVLDPSRRVLYAVGESALVVLGNPTLRAAVVRLMESGTPDTSFSGDGKLVFT